MTVPALPPVRLTVKEKMIVPALPSETLGLLIANGYGFMLSGKYWVAFYPGVALLIAIVAINLVGDQLRDVMNPRLKR